MGEYTSGAATKERILHSCEALFYKSGIAGTSYDHICEAAKINRGLIHYYFKSKNNIAVSIYQRIVHNIEETVSGFCDTLQLSFMESIIANELFTFSTMKQNPNFCRFYSEIMGSSAFYEAALREQSFYLQSIIKKNALTIDEPSFRTIAVMAQGTEIELVHGLARGYLLETVPQFVLRDVSCTFSMLGISNRKTTEWANRAVECISNYEMVCDEHFDFKIVHTAM